MGWFSGVVCGGVGGGVWGGSGGVVCRDVGGGVWWVGEGVVVVLFVGVSVVVFEAAFKMKIIS